MVSSVNVALTRTLSRSAVLPQDVQGTNWVANVTVNGTWQEQQPPFTVSLNIDGDERQHELHIGSSTQDLPVTYSTPLLAVDGSQLILEGNLNVTLTLSTPQQLTSEMRHLNILRIQLYYDPVGGLSNSDVIALTVAGLVVVFTVGGFAFLLFRWLRQR